ncbi:MAG: hypothetical protein F6K19_31280 [Cyanothece sp. SIO1E1]|nr:hypothetical protein [Cyanothece sp. SIO1E1]
MLTSISQALVLKRRLQLLIFFLIGLLLTYSTGVYLSKSAEAEMPFAADQFVDSVGLNVRMSYSDWPTATNWANPNPQQNIRYLIANLGIRHLRDRIPHPKLQPNISYVNSRLATLYLEHGMKFIVGLDFRKNGVLNESRISPFIDWYATGELFSESGEKVLVRDMLEAIEGPNEYDRHHNPEKREADWANNLHAFQDKIYQAVKSNTQLSSLPVIAPSLIHTAYCRSPLESFKHSANLGNLHPYPNYPYMRHPTATLNWHLERVFSCTEQLPIWATETGYSTASDNPTKINETTAAKYTSRLLAEYFLTGKFQRTFLHEIARGSIDGWGLVAAKRGQKVINGKRQFNLRPKPAYYAVKSLLQLLNEAIWVPGERQWVSPETHLRPVELSFKEKEATTHHLLLQKSNGHYFLLLWQEIESFNPERGNFEVQPDEMTVVLPQNFHPISLYHYDEEFMYTKTPVDNRGEALVLNVPDSVMLLEFSQ